VCPNISEQGRAGLKTFVAESVGALQQIISVMEAPTLYIIDGHSQVFKAYHAIQHLSTSTGIPTNAVFGFCQILHALLRNHSPEYLAVAFDRPEQTFRETIFEHYKANRPEPPADLPLQMNYIHKILEAMRIPYFEVPGFEADDVIATLTKQALERGFHVVIVTADKDLFQLVNDHVKILRLEPQGETWFDRETVREKMGVYPEQVLDLLALVGDTSDNIPGVRNVGPKTAAALLAKFGSLDGIYEHIDEVKCKVRENLLEDRANAYLSRELIALRQDVPLDIDWDALRRKTPDFAALEKLYRELEFQKFLQDILAHNPQPVIEETRALYRAVYTSEDLERLCEKIREVGHVAIDTETDSIDTFRAQLVGVSIACVPHEAVYIPLGHSVLPIEASQPQMSIGILARHLAPILRDSSILKIGHNLKFDRKVLLKYGLVFEEPTFDTLIASYLLNPDKRSHGLKNLAMDWLGLQMTHLEELIGKGKEQITFDEIDIDTATRYAAADADITLQLWEKLAPKLEETGLFPLFRNIEMPLSTVLIEMEQTGVRIDANYFRELARQMEADLNRLRERIIELAGVNFNPSSPKQVAEVLFEHLKLQPKRKGKTGYSTGVEVLEELAGEHELPRLILEYRQYEKLKNTYVDVLPSAVNPVTGRIHTTFNQTMAATGRLSSSDPNLQNIPVRTELGRSIRKGFIPSHDNYCLLSADYSQIELRILAHVSRDPELVSAFQNNKDVHALTASKIFGVAAEDVTEQQRDQAKVVNFGIIYGMSAAGLSQRLRIPLEDAKRFIAQYFEAYHGVKKWIDETLENARKQGFVMTLSGRRRYLPDINSQNYNARSAAERIAINAPIQGSSADMIKLAMLSIHRWLKDSGLRTRMIIQVHDELIFDTPEKELDLVVPTVARLMEEALPLDVPVKVDVKWGKNWAEC